ncbi:hypothetical protein RER_12530 [Rhodococcus erythropolis PR4]|uniref:Uncharacterized protein n=1 Tax=Rhodococcus erythropolis (strain PR4 / NBRC 100887) TaxID=234621 RepID=C0ZSY8_RHOE4|nr:hypothetical protein RER_12530 [Rhodococcus erythropolis PR4]
MTKNSPTAACGPASVLRLRVTPRSRGRGFRLFTLGGELPMLTGVSVNPVPWSTT